MKPTIIAVESYPCVVCERLTRRRVRDEPLCPACEGVTALRRGTRQQRCPGCGASTHWRRRYGAVLCEACWTPRRGPAAAVRP